MTSKFRKFLDEPNMSDQTMLVSVEDLIATAFGPLSKNTINFKLIQTILHILARQLRLLEQEVEIKFDEFDLGIGTEPVGDEYKSEDDGEVEQMKPDEGEGKGKQEEEREIEERGDKRGKPEQDKKERKKERGEKERKKEQDDREEKKERSEKGGKKERGEKTESRDKKEKRERVEKVDEGKASSKDREGKGGSRDRDKKDKGHKVKKGTDDDEEGEKRDGGQNVRSAKRDGTDQHGKRGGRQSNVSQIGESKGRRSRDDTAARGKHGKRAGGVSADREGSSTSITVTEAGQKDGKGVSKRFVAQKGAASRSRGGRVGSIEVVTASQFALLEKAVKDLEKLAGPLPTPSMPENEQLRADLAKGRASLSDTMQAVQLNARVQAAEQGLSRMAELLTQLAAAGVLPVEVAARVGMMQAELQMAATAAGQGGKSHVEKHGEKHGGKHGGKLGDAFADTGFGGAGVGFGGADVGFGGTGVAQEGAAAVKSVHSKMQSSVGTDAAVQKDKHTGVSHNEMQDVIQYEKGVIYKDIQNLTARANYTADLACNVSRNVADKLEIALKMNNRISTLFAQTADYANQLTGFDSGLTTQMSSFQEQMAVMKSELNGGLTLFETVNNSAETAAILDLNERCEAVVLELENTVHEHQSLANSQQQLSDELKSLVECVEMLREQKADRDEVLDGLRDKADISRLVGLLHEEDFAQTRADLERRIAKSYDKFNKQDAVWHTALEDLLRTVENKAPVLNVIALKKSVSEELNDIRKKLKLLEIMLGEPKAAILMRKLADNTSCGACLTRALMEPTDRTYGTPLALPPLRPAPLGAELPCLAPVLAPPDLRKHICHRWVGGSHTLLPNNVARERATSMELQVTPRRKYDGFGTDGKYYMMEEDLQPCAECNRRKGDDLPEIIFQSAPSPTGGGGDQRVTRNF